MDANALTLTLRPLHDGSHTQLWLYGPVATVAQPQDVRRLLKVLWLWHGGPIDVALYVDGTNSGACWAEIWEHVLSHVPARHLRLRFEIDPETIGPDDDERR